MTLHVRFLRAFLLACVPLCVAQVSFADGILFYKYGTDGRVWFLFGVQRESGRLDVPGGRPEGGERFAQAAARESVEELCFPLDEDVRLQPNGVVDVEGTRSYQQFVRAIDPRNRVGRWYVLVEYPDAHFDPANQNNRARMSRHFGAQQARLHRHRYKEMRDVVWLPCTRFLTEAGRSDVRHCAKRALRAAAEHMCGLCAD